MKQKSRLTQFKESQALCAEFIERWQDPDAAVAAVAQWAGLTNEQASSLAHWLRVNLRKHTPPVIIIKKTTGRKPHVVDFDMLAKVAREVTK